MLTALRQKIIANIVLVDGPLDSECWRWKAARNGTGYGALMLNGIWIYAHRASYMTFNGPIPEGKLIRHLCHVKECVSPYHLRLGSHRDNANDRYRRRAA
jgi:hypothetical protein